MIPLPIPNAALSLLKTMLHTLPRPSSVAVPCRAQGGVGFGSVFARVGVRWVSGLRPPPVPHLSSAMFLPCLLCGVPCCLCPLSWLLRAALGCVRLPPTSLMSKGRDEGSSLPPVFFFSSHNKGFLHTHTHKKKKKKHRKPSRRRLLRGGGGSVEISEIGNLWKSL